MDDGEYVYRVNAGKLFAALHLMRAKVTCSDPDIDPPTECPYYDESAPNNCGIDHLRATLGIGDEEFARCAEEDA